MTRQDIPDTGPDTLAWHLQHRHHVHPVVVSVSTIARILTRQSLVDPQPEKRPKSSYIRFEAEQPNETWQSDFTYHRLATGADTETITWLDDHSRYALPRLRPPSAHGADRPVRRRLQPAPPAP